MRDWESCTRRQVLRGAAVAATPGAGAAALSLSAGVAAASHPEEKPEYVTLSYDESLIKQYQPMLLLEGVEVEPQAFHALVARSQESELTCIAGFHTYTHQSGISSVDSHLGDHEPFYCYVRESTGELVKARYSAYHWYALTAYRESLTFKGESERAYARVIPKWHQHDAHPTQGEIDSARVRSSIADLEVRNLLESYPGWLDNGLEEKILSGAVYNPWIMQTAPHWWADTASAWGDRLPAIIFGALGIRGADLGEAPEVSTV